MGIDILGIHVDILGVDILGIDILALPLSYQGVARSFPLSFLCTEIRNVNTVRN